MKKLMNKKGFTLMEMLIVVAIIVILVAISVPTFTANLGEAKAATDAANLRAAKSAAQVYMINTDIAYEGSATKATYYYSVDKGDVVKEKPTTGYGETSEHEGKVIEIIYDKNGTVEVKWEGTAGDDAS